MALVEIPDPATFEGDWKEQWRKNLTHAALEAVKRRIGPEKFQIYSLAVIQKRGSRAVAELLGVNMAYIYLIRHRFKRTLEKEIEKLKRLEKIYP